MKRFDSHRGLTALAVALLTVLTLSLTACRNDIVYSRFVSVSHPDETIPSLGDWHVDSVVCFDYQIPDKKADYRMILYVRHTERYPYQNMWLFVDNGVRRDTIEFYLADDRGQWLGNRHHGFVEMPVLLEDHYRFPDTGMYHMAVQHGMRDSMLRGVTDVGLEIEQSRNSGVSK